MTELTALDYHYWTSANDFHAVAVMGAILGGLFNSRLQRLLRRLRRAESHRPSAYCWPRP